MGARIGRLGDWLRAAAMLAASALALLPHAALAQPLPIPVRAVQVAPHTWFVQGVSALGGKANGNFISNAGFVVTDTSVVVIDALGSPALARALIAEIRRVTPKPVSHVIVTHYHADHIYGLQTFRAAGAQIVASRRANEYLNSETAELRMKASRQELAPWIDERTELVPASRWIDDEATLDVGGTRFMLRAVGPAHTPEDVVVYVPSERVLFAGDLVFRNRIPYVGQADSRRWLAALDVLLAYDTAVIVPGHGPSSTEPRKDLTLTRDYLAFLRKSMGEAARNMEAFDEAYARVDWSQFEGLPLFGAANRMNAYNTYLLLEQERD
jgi:glyoxylase-like metal-dependent hydrolase (beta-lactamase superfamily II)